MRPAWLFALALWAACSQAHANALEQADQEVAHAIAASVFRVTAQRAGGAEDVGSAVLIAPERLVTNCHVTRAAKNTYITRAGRSWIAHAQHSDIERDVCLLAAPGVDGRIATLRSSNQLDIEEVVYAAGYEQDGSASLRAGQIVALYGYDGAHVLRTNAAFNRGQSGGGLFDAEGRLVGILTFKAASGGDFHFALPADWLQPLATPASATLAFWERAARLQPTFLRAAALEHARDWDALLMLSRQWSNSESDNPEAWIARGKAAHHNKRTLLEAATAFREAAKLNPKHRVARQQLSMVNRDLSCTRYNWCGTSVKRYQ